MSSVDDPLVIVIGRDRVRKGSHVGMAAAAMSAVVAGVWVAAGTSANRWSAAVAEFILRWTIAIGLVAAVFVALYWGVQS